MTDQYENMTRHELEARLHFLENHNEYLHKEIAKKDEQIAKLEEQNKGNRQIPPHFPNSICYDKIRFINQQRSDSK